MQLPFVFAKRQFQTIMDESVDTLEQNKRFLSASFRNWKNHLFCRWPSLQTFSSPIWASEGLRKGELSTVSHKFSFVLRPGEGKYHWLKNNAPEISGRSYWDRELFSVLKADGLVWGGVILAKLCVWKCWIANRILRLRISRTEFVVLVEGQ